MPTPTISPAPQQPPRSGYIEVEHVRDADGVLGIISRRVNGVPIHSIAIYKEFDRDGVTEKSVFWSVRQSEAVNRVLSIIVPRARDLEAKAIVEHETQRVSGVRR